MEIYCSFQLHFRVLLIGEWNGHKSCNGQIFYETHITRIRKSYVNDCLDKRKSFLLRVLSETHYSKVVFDTITKENIKCVSLHKNNSSLLVAISIKRILHMDVSYYLLCYSFFSCKGEGVVIFVSFSYENLWY